ncbi:sigma 54-interacting transcriptional regulator [Tissierella pigra]|uniref:PAS domain S-box protein n=1 Tax=Tissierella pigra TaxID=2607614 RepID=A0A6N7Y2J7_9FIRM|nr:sigma 54-interacting transcriptional regulator [Tissierella pigra]MBU5428055.1 sigma 54-interacting transcriptional regulator [Tissierella pigra]MSU02678.1 PAS domain S-box protein [Tissierella pigra]
MDYKNIIDLMINNLEEGIIVVDSDLKIRYFNESSKNITGFNSKEAIGKSILQVFPNIKREDSTFYKAINTKRPIIEHVQNYINYVGKSVSIVTSTIPIISNGRIQGAMEIFKDLSKVVELSEKILMLQSTLYSKDMRGSRFLQNGTQYNISDIIGQSNTINQLKSKIQKIANSNSPVFVFGETGTGKELVVQGIHNLSHRRSKPFIAQNCGALPENLLESIIFGTVQGSFTGAKDNPGLFELADGGTLFLDELNSMQLGLQSKLLRVIEDGIIRRIGSTKTILVDVRLIVASNEEPKRLLKENKIREDLYYRLNVLNLNIPPLRDRKEDIPILVDHFIRICNDKMNKTIKSIDSQVMEYFLNYDWPGNVRELQNTIESAMNFAEDDYIKMEDFQSYNDRYIKNVEIEDFENNMQREIDLKMMVEEYEKNIIKLAIDEANNNYAQAARNLKIPKQTLYSKLKRYKIDEKE